MSDRWNPKKLLRDRVINGISVQGYRRLEIERLEAQNLRSRLARMKGSTIVAYCSHNQPWITCTVCSRPRTK